MKIRLILIALFASVSCSATNFTFVIATTDTAYAKFALALAVADSDQAHMVQLGSRPVNPTYDTTAAQWNAYVTSVTTYDSSQIAIGDSFQVHQTTLIAKLTTLLGSLGYATGLANPVCGTWVKVQGSFTTAWIGYDCSLNSIINIQCLRVLFTKPQSIYPLN